MVGKFIEIVEVGPRDGLQNESVCLTVEEKANFIVKAASAGLKRIEAVSFVNPKRVPQMANAEDVVKLARKTLSSSGLTSSLSGLVLNKRGFVRAVEAGMDEINLVIVASETFNMRNQGASIADTLAAYRLVLGSDIVSSTPVTLTIAASFGCPFEGETSAVLVADIAVQANEIGIEEIALADTIGVASPFDVIERVRLVKSMVPEVKIRCHFHNTRNTGLANAYAAINEGVSVLDGSIGGIGGCPFAPAATGNIPTEDLVYMLNRMGLKTGLDIQMLCEISQWLESQLNSQPPGMVWRAGLFPTRQPLD